MFDGFAAWLLDLVEAIFQYMWTRLIAWLDAFFTWVWDLVPLATKEWLAQNPFSDMVGYFDAASYVFPIWWTIGIVGTVFIMVVQIRLTRWVLSFLPMLNAG